MAEVAIILGNGFDIDLGLPSKYSDFIKSNEWAHVLKRLKLFLLDRNYKNHSLVAQLQFASDELLWFDIEEEIHKFVLSHSENTDLDIRDIRNEFNMIRTALSDYLKRVSKELERKANEDRLSYRLLFQLQACPMSIIEIYFNYTNPSLFLPIATYYKNAQFTYVHGSLRNNDIVLGCDLQEGERVNRQLSFMYKYNMLNRANHVARNLLEAKEIIFFGHSVNEMDFGYFRDFFKAASAAPNPIRHLTMITFDEESERTIKDNIRNQGISVTDLYNNLWTFEFIHTKNVYAGDNVEIEKWNSMLSRLLAKDRHGI